MSSIDGYTLLVGKPEAATSQPCLHPFDDRVIAFLSQLSTSLMKDPEVRAFPDISTFAFFCRKAHLYQMRSSYEASLAPLLGRGLVFHIAPSNVPINFAYSLISALLAGNASIVKASSLDFSQTRLVCAAIQTLLDLPQNSWLASYLCVLTYPREKQTLTEYFSALCDVRITWGGDETIARVRKAALPPHAFDVTFADRYSLLVLQAEAVLALNADQLSKAAQGFYNDTYLTDQNACTAPRLIYWLHEGDKASLSAAQQCFWKAVHAYTAPRYPFPDVVAVDKLTALYRAAILLPDAHRRPMDDNLITRIQVGELSSRVVEVRAAGGLFLEYEDTSLTPLASIVQRKFQTLSYLGIDPQKLQAFVMDYGLRGIDRIVPLGHTQDFSFLWDGYDLIRTLSRSVSAQ